MENLQSAEDVEALVSAVWKDVLKLDDVDRDHDFIALGGHSLLAVQIAFKCQKVLNRRVTAAQVLRCRTVAALASALA